MAKGSENDADDLQQLKAIVAEQQQRLEMLEAGNGAPNGETKAKKATRRQLLQAEQKRVHDYVVADKGTAQEALDGLVKDWKAIFKEEGKKF